MKTSKNQDLAPAGDGSANDCDDHLHLRHEMAWFENLLGRIPLGSSNLIFSKPGGGKTTLALQIGMDCAAQGLHIQYVLTEQTEEQIRDRLETLLLSYPKSRRSSIAKNLTFHDRIPKIDGIPDYLLDVLSRSKVGGRIPDVLVVDSISGNGLHPASRSYQSVYSLLRICRVSRIPVFLIGHATKSGDHAGPLGLSHSVDTVSTIRAFWRFRYLFVQKNRSGRALGTPITLECDENGMLLPSPHSRPMTATARSFLPLSGADCEVQVSVEVPAIGQKPRIQCPGIPRSQISQLIQGLERYSGGNLSLNGLNVDVQMTGEEAFRKTLHLPVLMSTVASIAQAQLPQNALFVGEIDLQRNIRSLSRLNLENLTGFLQSGSFPMGTVLVCPRSDATALSGHSDAVRILGIESFDELIENVLGGGSRKWAAAA